MFLAAAAHVRLSLQGYVPVAEWIACQTCGFNPQRSVVGGFDETGRGATGTGGMVWKTGVPEAGNPPRVTSSIEVSGHPRIERAFTLTALAVPPRNLSEKPSHVRHVASSISPDQLLARAQWLRAHGQYKDCAQIYRRLWSEFPGSEEARVSMISLGELELVHTKNPASALDAFNAYLRLGGPLDREARYGKIRALRALDRRGEAEAETVRFLGDYPTSSQAATLRRELYDK
jgi:hypothetical protein